MSCLAILCVRIPRDELDDLAHVHVGGGGGNGGGMGDGEGGLAIKKPWGIMTTDKGFERRVGKPCVGGHEHAKIIDFD